MQSRHALIIEGNLSADEHIKHDSETPDINLWASVDFGVEELGSGEIQRSTERREVAGWVEKVGETKINDFDIAGLRDEDILDFEISVDDAVFMTVLERAANLTSELPSHSFPQSAVTDNVIQHLATVDVFENHVVVMLVDNHFPHAADIGMVEQHRERSLSHGSDLLRGLFRSRFCSRFGVGGVGMDSAWNSARKNFDSELSQIRVSPDTRHPRRCSPFRP
jgi:hypothetical protein